MVYLPYWLSATVCGFTAQKKKLWKFSFENFLLVFGAVILYKTISRAGLFAFLLILGYFFIRLNIWVVKKISQKWSATRWKSLIMIGVVLVMLAVYVGGAVGSFYFYSKLDKRMKDAFTSLQVLAQSGFSKYAEILQFGERVTYWQAGWATFNLHPVLGVGLGNAGYYFQQTLPDNAWQLTEVRHLQYHATNLMNIKSMWIRILAETGIAGFSVFLVLLVISLLTARELTHTKQPMKRTIGFMGICMLISFIMEGFSIDSFALPYLWFTLGLVAATWRWTKPEIEGE
jgi:O-antigen ligase